jgi:hypothetical protein
MINGLDKENKEFIDVTKKKDNIGTINEREMVNKYDMS